MEKEKEQAMLIEEKIRKEKAIALEKERLESETMGMEEEDYQALDEEESETVPMIKGMYIFFICSYLLR